MTKTNETNLKATKIVLWILAIIGSVGLSSLEYEKGNPDTYGLVIIIWTLNLGGIFLFRASARLWEKNHSQGMVGLVLACVVRILTFIYIAWLGGAFLVPEEGPVIQPHDTMAMIGGNMLILILEVFIHFFEKKGEEYKERLAALTEAEEDLRKEKDGWEDWKDEQEADLERRETNLKSREKRQEGKIPGLKEMIQDLESDLSQTRKDLEDKAKELEKARAEILKAQDLKEKAKLHDKYLAKPFRSKGRTHVVDPTDKDPMKSFQTGEDWIHLGDGRKMNREGKIQMNGRKK